jgi:hypothetical protein
MTGLVAGGASGNELVEGLLLLREPDASIRVEFHELRGSRGVFGHGDAFHGLGTAQ